MGGGVLCGTKWACSQCAHGETDKPKYIEKRNPTRTSNDLLADYAYGLVLFSIFFPILLFYYYFLLKRWTPVSQGDRHPHPTPAPPTPAPPCYGPKVYRSSKINFSYFHDCLMIELVINLKCHLLLLFQTVQ